jgi:phage-related minor tail protein
MARELKVVIAGDASGAEKALASVEQKSGKLSPAFGAVGKAAAAGFAAMGAATAGAAVGLFKVGESFDGAADTIRVGTGATGQALEALKGDFKAVVKDVPTDFASASTAIADLNTRTGQTGEPLQELSKRMLEMTRLAGGDLSSNIALTTRVFGDWGIATEDQSGTLDKLFRASQATGTGVDALSTNLVKFGAPLRQLGFDFDTSTALLGKFEKEGVNTELVMGSMRIALGKMAREGEPAQETFGRVVDSIKSAGSASEANALSLELFGAKAGPDMAAAIREGRFELGSLLDTVSNGSETILGAAADTESFSEKWTRFKNTVLVAIEPLAGRVFDAVGSAMEVIGPRIATLVEQVVPRIEAFVGVVAEIAGKVGEAFRALGEGDLQGLAEVVDNIFGNSGQLVAPIRNAAETIVGIFGRLRGAADQVVGWWQRTFGGSGQVVGHTQALQRAIEPIWRNIAAIISSAVDVIRGVIDTFVKVATALWDRFGSDLIAFAKRAWENVQRVVEGVTRVIKGMLDAFAGLLTGDWERFWGGIQNIVSGAWNTIQGIVRLAIDAVRTIIVGVLDAIDLAWDTAWNAMATFLRGPWDAVKRTVSDSIDEVKRTVGRGVGEISTAWSTSWRAVTTFFSDRWTDIKTAATNAIGDVKRTIGTVVGEISTAWSTAWQGIRGTLDGIWTSIKTAASTALGALGLEGIVSGAVTAISRIWNGLKGAFAAPINWVIENVINRFLSGVDKVAGALGFSVNVPSIPLVPTFHEGGVVGAGGRMTGGPLKPGERMIKAQDGEEVLTRDDPRHTLNRRHVHDGSERGIGDGDGVFGAIGRAVTSALDTARNLIAQTVRPAMNAALALTDGMAGRFGLPGRVVGGTARRLGEGALDWVAGADKAAEDELARRVPALGTGIGWRAMWDAVKKQFPSAQLFSAVRPGAVTRSGNASYHSMGRAIDITPSLAIAQWIRDHYKAITKELIFTPFGRNQLKNGQDATFSAGVASDHYDHAHWAMAKGGIVTRPIHALVGEAGPEAVIPLDRFFGSTQIPALAGGGGAALDTKAVEELPEKVDAVFADLRDRVLAATRELTGIVCDWWDSHRQTVAGHLEQLRFAYGSTLAAIREQQRTFFAVTGETWAQGLQSLSFAVQSGLDAVSSAASNFAQTLSGVAATVPDAARAVQSGLDAVSSAASNFAQTLSGVAATVADAARAVQDAARAVQDAARAAQDTARAQPAPGPSGGSRPPRPSLPSTGNPALDAIRRIPGIGIGIGLPGLTDPSRLRDVPRTPTTPPRRGRVAGLDPDGTRAVEDFFKPKTASKAERTREIVQNFFYTSPLSPRDLARESRWQLKTSGV